MTGKTALGLFERFRQKPPTVAEVDAEIARVEGERAELEQLSRDIEHRIADLWGGPAVSGLEAEAATLATRLRSIGIVRQRLTSERQEAERRDVEHALAEITDKAAQQQNELERLTAKRDAASAALKEAESELQRAHGQYSSAVHSMLRLESRLRDLNAPNGPKP